MDKYLSVDEYLNGTVLMDLPDEVIGNINTLIPKVNELLSRFGSYRKINSGFRTMENHQRIYRDINSKRKSQKLPPLKIPMASKHLIGAAVDLSDPDGKLAKWIISHVDILKELGLYCEDFGHTKGWAHIQCIEPLSKSRIFKP